VHAVSPNASGPFTTLATVLPAETHEVQPIVDHAGVWWLFHVGLSEGGAGDKSCNGAPSPPPSPPRAGGNLHRSNSGPFGPWTAVNLTMNSTWWLQSPCANPAPGMANDGSYVLLVCNDGTVWRAASFAGPWSKTWAPNLPPGQHVGIDLGGVCGGCPSGYTNGCTAEEHNTCSGVDSRRR
jgi:hypothetical protein